MSDFLNKLTAYGADVNGAMSRLLDDEELYSSCVDSFCDDEAFVLLGEAISQKDYSQAFDHAHTLKGVSANLGLTPLYNAINIIVEALRSSNYSDLEGQYKSIIKALQALKELV